MAVWTICHGTAIGDSVDLLIIRGKDRLLCVQR